MTAYFDDGQVTLLLGDVRECLRKLPTESVNCVVTSPPYWSLRDYGMPGQLGLEPTPEEYVANMVAVFREVRRVLRNDGTLWLNIGDCYATGGGRVGDAPGGGKQGEAWRLRGLMTTPNRMPLDGLKAKDLVGIPWMLAFALRADGWWLRQDIIWSKPNPMPESVRDRCTKAHEYLFLLSKSGGRPNLWRATDTLEWAYQRPDLSETIGDPPLPRWRGFDYYYDAAAIRESAGYPSDRPQNSFAREQPDIPFQKPQKRKNRTVRLGVDTHGGAQGSGYMEYPEDTRNKRSVWHIPTAPFPEAHFATFPPALVEPCILAGCPEGGIVLDPFIGSGTTAMVARQLGRRAVGIDLNGEYLEMAVRRIGAQMALIGEAV